MFDNLEDKIKQDAAADVSPRERIVKAVAIAVLSVLLSGGLYFAVRLVE